MRRRVLSGLLDKHWKSTSSESQDWRGLRCGLTVKCTDLLRVRRRLADCRDSPMRYPVLLVLFLTAMRVCAAGIVDTLILGDEVSERVHQFADDRSEVVKGLLDEPARR